MFFHYPELEYQGIKDKKILETVRSLPREKFINEKLENFAYLNEALPIDCNQTISQPFIVAYMTEQLNLKKEDRVLEIGTGSGFQTAVLAELAKEIYTIEIFPELSKKAEKLLREIGFKNVKFRVGDGKDG
jgi:protein-L-isoaspartate(D-aspartate) O-methyltransferase